jgi:hypothetical protein
MMPRLVAAVALITASGVYEKTFAPGNDGGTTFRR